MRWGKKGEQAEFIYPTETLARLVGNLRRQGDFADSLHTGFGDDGAEYALISFPSCRFQILPYTEDDFRIRITLTNGDSFISGETWVPTDGIATQDKALADGFHALLEAARNDAPGLVSDGMETSIGYVYFDPEPAPV